ncbi:glycoside hydrolase family 15 protein [Sphaerobolus stellatus SS14]|nr:glycoside hydrolase family 15 protein [Sphaerobolus stellatus SS14]
MTNPNTREERGYLEIQDHGLVGNMRTAALISIDGSVESYCVPHFDSPSVFARILDKDKGGHFSVSPRCDGFSIKQAYLPNSNILTTKYLHTEGVAQVTDFLPLSENHKKTKPLLFWLIRRVEVIRGKVPLHMECAPAFNYARSAHRLAFRPDTTSDPSNDLPPGPNSKTSIPSTTKALFLSPDAKLNLELRYVPESAADDVPLPKVDFKSLDLRPQGHLGLSACADMELSIGQSVWFILRVVPDEAEAENENDYRRPTRERAKEMGVSLDALISGDSKLRPPDDPILTTKLLNNLLQETNRFWTNWILKSTYQGSWREAVHRSALALKLLIFEPTGAVIASPTFSLPEMIGGTRNWDYRYSWIRDSSFTLYALIRLGFTQEANAYMEFIFSRLQHRNPDGSLQIMYSIHGEKDLEEIELSHLDGHKGSKPVRIGNGAADHIQLDIYGELLDCIYLSQKFGKPLSYDIWVSVRELTDYVVKHYNDRDLSIWEVREQMKHFTYSKIMMWVAIDRALRLAEKRSFPCPNRLQWYAARDQIYEDIMRHAWNEKEKFISQSYDDKDTLDSAVLIMPLVFFCSATDERFLSTLHQILKTPEKGGLTANNLVYRYDVNKTNDGVGGDEGTFCLCTLWAIEALTRAGQYDPVLLARARTMFEDFLQYTNHLGLCTEEIGLAGEGLGNAVQGFTHVTLISAAYNLSRTIAKVGWHA